MRRLILTAALLMLATQTGHASLECDGYFDAGYFGTTYYQDGYWPENACGAGGTLNKSSVSMGLSRVTI